MDGQSTSPILLDPTHLPKKGWWSRTNDVVQDVLTHSSIIERRVTKSSLYVGGLIGAPAGAALMWGGQWDQILLGACVGGMLTGVILFTCSLLITQCMGFFLLIVFPPRKWFYVVCTVGSFGITLWMQKELKDGVDVVAALLVSYVVVYLLCLIVYGVIGAVHRSKAWISQSDEKSPVK